MARADLESTMKVMTYNILEGGVGRVDPLAEVVRLSGADVVVVEEAWDEGLFHKLADRVGMDRFWAASKEGGQGACGVLSRLAIREGLNHGVMDRRVTRSLFHVVVEWGERRLPVVGSHLHPGELFADEEVRLGEIEAVMEVTKGFGGVEHLLCGDFNASHPEQRIDIGRLRESARRRVEGQGGVVPREVVRRVLEFGYLDGYALHHAPADFGGSFLTRDEAMRVDYVFVTAGLAPKVKGCEIFKTEMGRFASDHYPVVMELGE